MIEEYNKNIKKCPNCSTLWTFSDEDVKEKIVYDGFCGDYIEHYIEHYIKCPKCKNHLELFNVKGVWR